MVSADAITHELLNPQTDLGQKVIQTLGSDVLQQGKINRSIVADKAFKDPTVLRKLEELLHPAVLKEIEERYNKARRAGTNTLFVVEIPLLYEIGAENFYDVVVAVVADESIARKRFPVSGHAPEEYERRMNRQLPIQQKSGRAHYIINNSGSLADLNTQVEQLYAALTK